MDVTSYEHTNESYPGENYYYNYEWTGNVYIFGGDYAGNNRGYESEMYLDSYYGGYTYDPATGEIVVNEAPYGASNILVIRADGVENPDAPGGTNSSTGYTRPDATYGPFNWTVTEGNGTLVEADMELNGEIKSGAQYTPAEPGVSYITAASKDGRYSVNFAVISQPVQAEKIPLEANQLALEVGETAQLTATLTPEPSLEAHQALVFTSFDPSVATVDENGKVTAVGPGYSYIKIASAINSNVLTYCIVSVGAPVTHTVTFVANGEIISTQSVVHGEAAVAPEAPIVEGNTFTGWDTDFSCVTTDLTVTAQYETNTYPVLFVADGRVVGSITVPHGYVLKAGDYPAVPVKDGYTGQWQAVTAPVTDALTIEAVYTALPTDSADPSDPTSPLSPPVATIAAPPRPVMILG